MLEAINKEEVMITLIIVIIFGPPLVVLFMEKFVCKFRKNAEC